jgi:hypothetical protein
MDRVPVRSTNLASIGYDPGDGILEIEFSSGAIYEYYRVPGRVFDGLLSASSPGLYFASNVKDVYQFRRIT